MPRKTRTRGRIRRRAHRRFNEAAARCRGKPRETPLALVALDGFNEAAARCRGKRQWTMPRTAEKPCASMRPRPDAAENPRDRAIRSEPTPASMRPRPDAAENSSKLLRSAFLYPIASMRPRPDAAENLSQRLAAADVTLASMRPRPDAAENPRPAPGRARAGCCFNEAAARCRGKRASASEAEAKNRWLQ